MKITNVEAFPVWSGARNFLFVVVDTDEGIYGLGEAGLTGREQAVVGAIEHLKPLLIGQDPRRKEHIWQTLFRGGFFPAGKVLGSAISAIDIALWDIDGKALGVPVYDLLGGRVRDKVVCYPHNGGATIPALVESCLKTTAEGWRFVRWGLGDVEGDIFEPRRAVRLAIKQMQAVREAVGDDIEIVFDVHTRLDLPDASRSAARSSRCTPSSWRTRCARRTPIRSRRCARAPACRWPPASSSARSGSFAS